MTPFDEYSSSYPMKKSLGGGKVKFVKGKDLPKVGKAVDRVKGKVRKKRRKKGEGA